MATAHEMAAVEGFAAGMETAKRKATAGLQPPSLQPRLVEHPDGSVYDDEGRLVRKARAKQDK